MLLFILISFLGGILSILSPCSGVILPVYFGFAFKHKEKLVLHTLLFSLGVIITAIPIGIGAVVIFTFLRSWGVLLFKLIGLFFILSAVALLIPTSFLHKSYLKMPASKKFTYFSSFLFGVISALSLGTCSGPILGAIATLSASTGSFVISSILMFFYVLGILVPFVLLSFSADKFLFLKNIFVKGKLFKLSIFNKKYIIHSTNLISFFIFIFKKFFKQSIYQYLNAILQFV